jgi:hypothetical protein
MLAEAGFNPGLCRYTNVINIRPPENDIDWFFRKSRKAAVADGAVWFQGRWCMPEVVEAVAELKREISRVKPKLVLALGNTALWALTENSGITKWRGSQLELPDYDCKLVPLYHPAAILRSWDLRWITVTDLKRAKRWMAPGAQSPNYNFILRPSLRQVAETLVHIGNVAKRVAVDIETRNKQIACLGIAWSRTEAICIPILCVERPAGYWTLEEEVLLYKMLRALLTKVEVVGQNFIYDMQYTVRQAGILPNFVGDTMVAHHTAFPGTPKGLDFISSLYNEYHCYWKDEGKSWDPSVGEEQLWIYNCKDAVATFEADQRIGNVLDAFKLRDQYEFQLASCRMAFRMMLRGIRTDLEYKAKFSRDTEKVIFELECFINRILGVDINVKSPKQMQTLCYQVLNLPPKFKKTKDGKRLTCDATAIEEWTKECEPLFRPVLQAILDIRSLNVFRATFGEAGVDWDGRLRCTYYVAGPETFRWASAEDAFGYGMNLQNVPQGG